MEKVIFDTNSMRNTEPRNFLGNRAELEKFAKVAEIVIPDIVIEEIKHQKRRNLSSKKQSFLSNPFHWMREVDEDDTKQFDINGHIDKLEDDEPLNYDVIGLSDTSCLIQMKEMALKGLPPFEKDDKVGNDKGFKDAYIYFTILEYLQNVDDKYIFLVTKDSRLGEAFENNPNVYVIKNFDEFVQRSISTLYDDYFIEKLQTEVDENITKEGIIDYWVSIKDNQILLIQVDEDTNYIVEVDSGEIVDWVEKSSYKDDLENLITSGSYKNTISLVRKLKRHIEFFTEEEIIRTLTALVENSQIRGTIGAGVYTINFMKLAYALGIDKLDAKIIEQIPESIKQA